MSEAANGKEDMNNPEDVCVCGWKRSEHWSDELCPDVFKHPRFRLAAPASPVMGLKRYTLAICDGESGNCTAHLTEDPTGECCLIVDVEARDAARGPREYTADTINDAPPCLRWWVWQPFFKRWDLWSWTADKAKPEEIKRHIADCMQASSITRSIPILEPEAPRSNAA